MKIHRFYITPEELELTHEVWVNNRELLHQWQKVLRFKSGQQLVLFDGARNDRLYQIDQIESDAIKLSMITDMKRNTPKRNVYLLWSLLKKDKNDWVLQKCTELGVSHFLPILADRSEKTGFNHERAQKIVIEAVEQCGRSDIPTIREPMHILNAIEQLSDKVDLYICEQDGPDSSDVSANDIGVFIGPEGGWSDAEKQLFKDKGIKHLNLHNFTLRAETAAVTAAGKLL